MQTAKIATLICLSSNDTSERALSSGMLQVKYEIDLAQKLSPPEISNTF